jgi:hypothetical protein
MVTRRTANMANLLSVSKALKDVQETLLNVLVETNLFLSTKSLNVCN